MEASWDLVLVGNHTLPKRLLFFNHPRQKAKLQAGGWARQAFDFKQALLSHLPSRPESCKLNTMPAEVLSTGSLALDIALGVGGVPRGYITEIFGPEASGKTTLCQHIVAEAQRQGGVAAYIDMEHALDPDYAARCGVDVDRLLVSQPGSGEQALATVEALALSGAVAAIIVDSVAALVPQAELEAGMGAAPKGLQAQMMAEALRKLSGALRKARTALVFTNQLRQNLSGGPGSAETTPGGQALKFHAAVRLDLRAIRPAWVDGELAGYWTRARVVKNKLAPPFFTAEFVIMYNGGISKTHDLLELALESGFIQQQGPDYLYGAQPLGRGREAALDHLRQHADLAAELETRLRQQFRSVETYG
jgi:recombination protein RecA